MSSREWDAASYHRISEPQLAWAREQLERLELSGEETVLDAGCGSGRVTDTSIRSHRSCASRSSSACWSAWAGRWCWTTCGST
jgi:cyclopropane fatty-acyl-phospholipid synthase-like methyltransferase